MSPRTEMPFTLPPDLVTRLEEAAREAGKSPVEMLEGWLELEEKERRWQALLGRGAQRGAAVGTPADEEDVNDLVNARIAESRREQRDR